MEPTPSGSGSARNRVGSPNGDGIRSFESLVYPPAPFCISRHL